MARKKRLGDDGKPTDTVRTSHVRRTFLKMLSEGYSVQGACLELNVSRSNMYKWYREDEKFRKEWDEAVEASIDLMEQEAFRRAVKGTREPVVSAGQVVTYQRRYSDGLLQFLMKSRRKHVYGDVSQVDLNANVSFTGAAERLATKLAALDARKAKGKLPEDDE